MQVTIGSNRLRATDGVVSIRGRRQISFEWGSLRSELLLTMDLFSIDGRHIARLRRNQWTFNDGRRFYLTQRGPTFTLTDGQTDQVVLAGRAHTRDAVVITEGAFYGERGQDIQIMTEDWGGAARLVGLKDESRSTMPPFGSDECAAILRAVRSSVDSLDCPRCRRPLTTLHMDKLNSVLITCTACRGTLVIPRQA